MTSRVKGAADLGERADGDEPRGKWAVGSRKGKEGDYNVRIIDIPN